MTALSCFACLYADVKFPFAQQALAAAEAGRRDAERAAEEMREQFGAAVAAKERLEMELAMITKRCVVSHPCANGQAIINVTAWLHGLRGFA
jgi:hypothetical protein